MGLDIYQKYIEILKECCRVGLYFFKRAQLQVCWEVRCWRNKHTQTHTRNRNKPLNFVFLLEERGTKHTSKHTPKADLLRPCCKKMCYLWGASKALSFTFGALDGFGTILWSRISARLDPLCYNALTTSQQSIVL